MANGFEIVQYKQKIASMLINNEHIVDVIGNKDIEEPEELIEQNIFNYLRYPFAPEEELTFICFEVECPEVYSDQNYLFKQNVITFYIVTHERLMPTVGHEGATRIDLLAAYVDEMFNGARGFGSKPLELISSESQPLSLKHRCRILKYATDDLNKNLCRK